MIILYLLLLISGLFWVSKNLLPEMAKPSTPAPKRIPKVKPSNSFETTDTESRIQKLEMLLEEKNTNITLLQNQLKISLIQVRESDKVRNILELEIQRLREQNRMFRSELGLPAVTAVENASPLFL